LLHCCVGLGYYSDWALKPVQSRLRSSALDLLPDPEHAGPMKVRGPCGGSESSVRPKSRVAQPSLTTGGYCSAAPLVPTGLPRQRGSTRRTQSGTGRLRAAPDANHFSTSGTGRQLFTRAAPDANHFTANELRQQSSVALSSQRQLQLWQWRVTQSRHVQTTHAERQRPRRRRRRWRVPPPLSPHLDEAGAPLTWSGAGVSAPSPRSRRRPDDASAR